MFHPACIAAGNVNTQFCSHQQRALCGANYRLGQAQSAAFLQRLRTSKHPPILHAAEIEENHLWKSVNITAEFQRSNLSLRCLHIFEFPRSQLLVVVSAFVNNKCWGCPFPQQVCLIKLTHYCQYVHRSMLAKSTLKLGLALFLKPLYFIGILKKQFYLELTWCKVDNCLKHL